MNKQEYFEARIEATLSPMDYIYLKKKKPESVVLIDVRNGPAEARKNKIQDALIIPQSEIEVRLHEIPKDKKVVVYCWDVWCNTAAKVASKLLKKGYSDVQELTGGIAAWEKMNFPQEPIMVEESNCGC
ncbi:rhodanese-like domain-containing protein [Rossellomorea vietnamensis]|uniref:Rhodanese-like domain-containing protein n=1 Tax=Rossellomorea vietnamensis TaxID=218284 RepID=A0A6I6UMH2_9BACI|nr:MULTISPECIES: rhodanese-like domain-containing protein [Rossellomorea]QHE60241.1 rhodanese-like domain-containing protein [Rossellomorea vietnamensis]UTE78332.1 rhodanese-like domain-containing protein [Rossellomorea sp. KS-H15a]